MGAEYTRYLPPNSSNIALMANGPADGREQRCTVQSDNLSEISLQRVLASTTVEDIVANAASVQLIELRSCLSEKRGEPSSHGEGSHVFNGLL